MKLGTVFETQRVIRLHHVFQSFSGLVCKTFVMIKTSVVNSEERLWDVESEGDGGSSIFKG